MDKNSDKGSINRGYGKPPKKSQFKPGQSGNPKGRPKKPRSLAEAANKQLQEMHFYTDGGVKKRGTALEISMRNLISKAAKGEIGAFKLLHQFLTENHSGNPSETEEEIAHKAKLAKKMVGFLNEYAQMKLELASYKDHYPPPPKQK